MSAPAPELPRRTPGAALLAGDEFEQRPPAVEGPPGCFECGRRPARFTLTMTTPTLSGGQITVSRQLCPHDAASVAADLPADVDVIITRLNQEKPRV